VSKCKFYREHSCPNRSFNDVDLTTTTSTQYGPDKVLILALLGGVDELLTVYLLKPRVVGWLC
jgi:hypothetical protein